jgi:HPt (histidine-containing phosphotransfer) domain-containing protein
MARSFDGAELLERVENDWEFLGDTVQMLSSDGPALLAEIRRSGESGDAPAVGKAAHTLKGMISNFCAPAAQEAALALEKLGKAGDLGGAGAALGSLRVRLADLTRELGDFVRMRT